MRETFYFVINTDVKPSSCSALYIKHFSFRYINIGSPATRAQINYCGLRVFLHARFYSLLTFCPRFKYLALSLNCYETLNLIWCIHCFTRQFIVKNHTYSTILLHNTQCDKVHLANSIVVNGPRRKDTIYIFPASVFMSPTITTIA